MSEMLQMRRVVAATALLLGSGALVGCSGEGEHTDKPVRSEPGLCDGLQNTVGEGTNQEICYPEENLRVVLIQDYDGTSVILNETCDGTTLQIKQEGSKGAKKVLVPSSQENMPVCEDSVLTKRDYRGAKKYALY
jgi:hypothetical protein